MGKDLPPPPGFAKVRRASLGLDGKQALLEERSLSSLVVEGDRSLPLVPLVPTHGPLALLPSDPLGPCLCGIPRPPLNGLDSLGL